MAREPAMIEDQTGEQETRKNKKERYAVFYKNAIGRDKENKPIWSHHEGRSGQLYAMHARYAAHMKLDDAIGFLKAGPEFTCIDSETGAELRLSDKLTNAGDGRVQLADNQCVATYDELTREALFGRVKTLPGGQTFGVDSRKDELIAFLTDMAIEARVEQQKVNGKANGGEESAEIEAPDDPDGDAAAADAIFAQRGVTVGADAKVISGPQAD